MKIILCSGSGTGPTKMAAFDAALVSCGMYHNNLIHLSSMIPAGSVIEDGILNSPEQDYGERLYVVMARKDENIPGKEAWAGLGWVQDQTGKGMFVELEGHTKEQVKDDIRATLKDMMTRRTDIFNDICDKVTGIRCEKDPVCALVIAFFPLSERWMSNDG